MKPIEQQDRINEGFLKLDDGSYERINARCYANLKDGTRVHLSATQDEVRRGFVRKWSCSLRSYEDRYIPVDQIKSFEFGEWENEQESGCFVATKVYGNPQASQVQALRQIRDKTLMPNPVGRKFVDWYYSGNGKRAAKFIGEKMPCLVSPIRAGLDFVVRMSK
jgi:hypothetical protein